jgi:hypothetical protein
VVFPTHSQIHDKHEIPDNAQEHIVFPTVGEKTSLEIGELSTTTNRKKQQRETERERKWCRLVIVESALKLRGNRNAMKLRGNRNGYL